MIIRYIKFTDEYTTYALATPHGVECTELCTIDGITYVSIPAGTDLPAQPEQIAASVAVVDFAADPALKEAIKAASPHCALIDERMREKIRAAYTMEDELKYARIGVGAAMGMYQPTQDEMHSMAEFGLFVESVRQWGKAERAKLGLA